MNYMIKYLQVAARGIINDVEPPQGEIESRPEWFGRLKDSIREHGVVNPVILTFRDNEFHVRYGGSRVWAASQYDLTIPAIVADFDGTLDGEPVDPTPGAVAAYFETPPRKIIFKDHGINASGCPDLHIED